MTLEEKLAKVKQILGITDESYDEKLTMYLNLSKDELLSWLYSGKIPEGVTDVPPMYEVTQIMACVVGFGLEGAEGQLAHSENGISRSWKYSDMVEYIRNHVFPNVEVL